MPTDLTALASVVVGALGGAAIGVERQRSGHATGEYARFGGVRTFTLLGQSGETTTGVAPTVAAEAIAIGILANSILKLFLTLALGTPQFQRASGVTLAAMPSGVDWP